LRRLALLISLAILALSASTHHRPARAAEIECVGTIFLGSGPIPEAAARQVWPSGFRPVPGMCATGYLHGIIVGGDFEKVSDFYKRNHRVLSMVKLWSSGGEVDVAIKIGRLMRKYLISVEAPETWYTGGKRVLDTFEWDTRGSTITTTLCAGPDCVCASACALIWFGGVDRSGEVGLHRPRIDDPQFKSLSPTEATAVYRRTLEDIEAYLREMEIPRPIIDRMVATGSSEIQWVEAEKDHLERPPSFAEWEDANCGTFTREESNTSASLHGKERASSLSPNEALLLRLLDDKHSKRISCTQQFRHRQVDQLSPP